MAEYNYDNRCFVGVENYDDGDLTEDVIFTYFQNESTVWGMFEGGRVRFGSLVADVMNDGSLNMVWQYLNIDHELIQGICHSVPEILPDGRYRLRETWKVLTEPSLEGTSVVEEIEEDDEDGDIPE